MSAWRSLAAGTVVVAAALLTLPPPAAVASSVLGPICFVPRAGYDPFRTADVVAEGVMLSGPSFYGALLSPARFHVARYLKGRGPRVIRVRTPQRQVATGDIGFGPDAYGNETRENAVVPDGAETPRAGEAYRILARRRGRRGELKGLIDTCTGDDRRISIRRVLRPVPRTLLKARHDGRSWGARLLRGRGQLHCLRLVEPSSHFQTNSACGYLRRYRSTLLAHDDEDGVTAVALAGKRLSGFSAIRSTDGARVDVAARRGVAFAVLPGSLAQKQLAIVARYRDGSTRRFGGPDARATLGGPVGGPSWFADHERAHPSSPGRRACVVVGDWPYLGRSGECGSTGRNPFFFAIRRVSRSTYAVGGKVTATPHTAVFGALTQTVSDLTVTGPSGSLRPAISRRGRSFIAILPGHVPVSQITLSFVMRDGRTLSYTGRREANLAPAPRS